MSTTNSTQTQTQTKTKKKSKSKANKRDTTNKTDTKKNNNLKTQTPSETKNFPKKKKQQKKNKTQNEEEEEKGNEKGNKNEKVSKDQVIELPKKTFNTNKKSGKHYLHNKWTLWVDGFTSSKKWGEDLTRIFDFETLEDFWALYNNLCTAFELKTGANFRLFKYGIKPEWEDEHNQKGGRWSLKLTQSGEKLESIWLDTMLSMIGEHYQPSDEICGAVLSKRRGVDRISLWTKTSDQQKTQETIGKKWKQEINLVNLFGPTTVTYVGHKQFQGRTKSSRRFTTNYEV
ncbi:eukaryotic translation initiation factor 4e related [Anaeramoeba flamelloides]|uniref:Eukaryotic translation initiation factor 4e related n=1 Tax=Anaeramoeba flamelloides TaxID=1746091 RepID=A0AAV8AE80_9EUKA|nr:eukaryotic translation initiation factor 4e related [Anaeramoeba flamelloides]